MELIDYTGIKVKLVSHTNDPVLTLYSVWKQSRAKVAEEALKYGVTDDTTTSEMRLIYETNSEFKSHVDSTVDIIMSTDLPPMEFVSFEWEIQNIPVFLREQLVRHRDSHVWVRSSRDFHSTVNAAYAPIDLNEDQRAQLSEAYDTIQSIFEDMKAQGIMPEDARVIMPEGRLHSLSWGMTARSMYKIMKERACYLGQSPWKFIISEMVRLLDDAGLGVFARKLGTPPCKYDGGKCPYVAECEMMHKGQSKIPVCPVYSMKNYPDNPLPEGQNKVYMKAQVKRLLRIWDLSKLDNETLDFMVDLSNYKN